MILLDGKKLAEARKKQLAERVQKFSTKAGRAPKLVVVITTEIVASQVYVRNKMKACESVGILSEKIEVPKSTRKEVLTEILDKLNHAPDVDGVLVQLPLAAPFVEAQVNSTLSWTKDADGLTYTALGKLFSGDPSVAPIVAPCTPQGIIHLLQSHQIEIAGRRALVIGRSNIVGKPMALLLLKENATVTIAHSKTKDLHALIKNFHIVVVAMGQRNFFKASDFASQTVVVDVGIHGSGAGGSITGDVDFSQGAEHLAAHTPVPGGVGPMTIMTLLENTMKLAETKLGIFS